MQNVLISQRSIRGRHRERLQTSGDESIRRYTKVLAKHRQQTEYGWATPYMYYDPTEVKNG